MIGSEWIREARAEELGLNPRASWALISHEAAKQHQEVPQTFWSRLFKAISW